MSANVLLGIRREDKNPWERRVPLTPIDVRELMRELPLEVWVQPSPIRVFADEDYRREGARVAEDLSPCRIILAVKEIPDATAHLVQHVDGVQIAHPIPNGHDERLTRYLAGDASRVSSKAFHLRFLKYIRGCVIVSAKASYFNTNARHFA